MEGSDRGLTGVVERYLSHLDEGGQATPREFLVSCGLEPDSESVEILSLVAPQRSGAMTEGMRIGRYRLIRERGRGAQGVVFEAEDTSLRRTVALKVLVPHAAFGSDLGRIVSDGPTERQARAFEREALAASRLDHPGICTVYEAGVEHGVPYLAMRYVGGGSLSERIRSASMPDVTEAVALVASIAHALHAAHEAGLIHRDLKPGNILLDERGDPVICDFGLARGEGGEWDALTRTGEARGTPAYMSPEQLRAAPDQPLDRRTDVYSLGVVLFELITGERPVTASSWDGIFREILHEPTPDPRERNRRVGRDLAVVVATAMEKDRDRRYATARDFAEDLERVQRREPVRARAAGPWLRLRRWVQRSPGPAALLGCFLLACVLVPLFLVGQERRVSDRLREGKRAVEREYERADRERYEASIAAAYASLRIDEIAEARRRLDACPPPRRHWEWRYLRHASDVSVVRFAGNSAIAGMAFVEPDQFVSVDTDSNVVVRETAGGAPVRTWRAAGARGRTLAVDARARWLAMEGHRHGVHLFDLASGRRVHTLRGHTFWVRGLAFVDEGALLVSGGEDGTIRVWETESGRSLHTLDPHAGDVMTLAAIPGGTRFLTAGRDGKLLVHDARTGRTERTVARLGQTVFHLAVRADGEAVLVSFDGPDPIRLISLSSGETLARYRGHARRVSGLAFLDGVDRIAFTSPDGTVRIGRPDELSVQVGHEGAVAALAVAGANAIWTGGQDGVVRRWEPDPRRAAIPLRREHDLLEAIAFDAAGDVVAYGGWGSLVRVADIASGRVVAVARGHEDRIFDVVFEENGNRFATASRDGTVRIWNANDGTALTRMDADAPVNALDWRDGQIVGGTRKGVLHVWDATSHRLLRRIRTGDAAIVDLAFAADGAHVATVTRGVGLQVWRTADGKQLRAGTSPAVDLSAVAWCPRTDALATADESGAIRVLRDGQTDVLRAHASAVRTLRFHPSGTRLLSGGVDGVLRIWSVESLETLLVLRESGALIKSAVWSRDGERVAAAGFDRHVRLWETERPAVPAARPAVRAMVDAWFGEHVYSPFVLDAVAASTLSASDRAVARSFALSREEDAWQLLEEVRRVVRRDDAGEEAYRAAESAARAAHRILPAAPVMSVAKGASLYRLGRIDAACERLRAVIQSGHRTVEALTFAALAFAAAGDMEEAVRMRDQAERLLQRRTARPDLMAVVREARAATDG